MTPPQISALERAVSALEYRIGLVEQDPTIHNTDFLAAIMREALNNDRAALAVLQQMIAENK